MYESPEIREETSRMARLECSMNTCSGLGRGMLQLAYKK